MKTALTDRREKPCGGDFSLHQQDLTLQESEGNCHIFARPITASGALRLLLPTTPLGLLPPPV